SRPAAGGADQLCVRRGGQRLGPAGGATGAGPGGGVTVRGLRPGRTGAGRGVPRVPGSRRPAAPPGRGRRAGRRLERYGRGRLGPSRLPERLGRSLALPNYYTRIPSALIDRRESSAIIMATKTVSINRAPVLTLWAAVVAERLGFDEDEALTLGKVVAGLNAQ